MATTKQGKKRNNTLIYILLALVVGMVAFAFLKGQNREKGERVSAEEAATRTIMEKVNASGKIFPVTEVKISSDVSGEIVELNVEEGDSVVVGQILARIDPDAYQSQVERGQAAVNSARAQVANSQANVENMLAQKEQIAAQLSNTRDIHKRNEQLKKDGVISDADFESSLATLQGLEANLRSAEAGIRSSKQSVKAAEFNVKSSEASLKELRTNLNRTTVFATASGVISKLNVEKGERIVGNQMMSGTEIMRIANLNAMEVQVEVSENDIPRVSINDDVEIEVDAYVDRKFKGKVSQVANSSNDSGTGIMSLTSEQVTNFVVTINIDPTSYADLVTAKKPYPFRPGMSASVEILTNTITDVLSVPIQAVTVREKDSDDKKKGARAKNVNNDEVEDDDLLEVVFIVDADTVRMQTVTTGIQDNDYIQIKTGLNGGEQIVTAPYAAVSRELEAGDEVNVVDEEDLYKKD